MVNMTDEVWNMAGSNTTYEDFINVVLYTKEQSIDEQLPVHQEATTDDSSKRILSPAPEIYVQLQVRQISTND